jgi:predicted secreted protein
MNVFSGILVYVLAWWMMFFCMLPFGIQSIEKPKDGSMPGAPVNPGLKLKIILATVLAAIVWLGIYLIVTSDLISFHDIAAKMSM